jgi:hypothetical protein
LIGVGTPRGLQGRLATVLAMLCVLSGATRPTNETVLGSKGVTVSLDLSGYNQFVATVEGIENPLALDVRVDPASNKGANLLSIYTGTVILGKPFFGLGESEGPTSSDWSRGILRFDVPTLGRIWGAFPLEGLPDTFTATFFHGGTVVVSLASIFNRTVANNAGWAVDGADLRALAGQDIGLQIEAKLAVRDDGFLHRLSYQVTALGVDDRPRVIGSVLT